MLDAWALTAPERHLLLEIVLDLLGHLLKEGAGSPATSRTAGDLRTKASESQRLQYLLTDSDLFRTVSARGRRQRYTDGVTDALLQQDAQSRRAGDNALRSEPGLGEAKMERIVAAGSQHSIDIDQILHSGDLCAQHDAVVAHAAGLGQSCRLQGTFHHRFHDDVACTRGYGSSRVRVHQPGEEALIQ
jgi:hypothetical protein